MNIYETLGAIQNELKAPKNKWNDYGKYHYRNLESIFEGVKPILKKYNASLRVSDEIVTVADRVYVKATAYFRVGDDEIQNSAYAREELTKKGMDGSQITGTASTYARKYALNGLLLIDDTKDSDTNENHVESENRAKEEAEARAKEEAERAEIENNLSKPINKHEADILAGMLTKDQTAWVKKTYGSIDRMTGKQYAELMNTLKKREKA